MAITAIISELRTTNFQSIFSFTSRPKSLFALPVQPINVVFHLTASGHVTCIMDDAAAKVLPFCDEILLIAFVAKTTLSVITSS